MRNLKHIDLAAILTIVALMLFLQLQDASAQYKEKDENYSNTPTEMLPYGNYQDA